MKTLEICEVGPRDGLQSLGLTLSEGQRENFIGTLIDAGLTKLEVGSIVNPAYVPEMAWSDTLYKHLTQKYSYRNDLIMGLLIPNMKGLKIALSVNCKYLAFFTATSETFNKKNIHISPAESLTKIQEMLSGLKNQNILKRLYISTVFHCAYEGIMDVQKVFFFEEVFSEFDEISLGDTTGRGQIAQLKDLCDILEKKPYKEKIWWHFHDTYNMAEQNAKYAMERGYTKFDSSAGGIGGCPFSPGAKGNISTEKIISTAQSAGLHIKYNAELIQKAGYAVLSYQSVS